MAESRGFEPLEHLRALLFSGQAQLATLPTLQNNFNKAQIDQIKSLLLIWLLYAPLIISLTGIQFGGSCRIRTYEPKRGGLHAAVDYFAKFLFINAQIRLSVNNTDRFMQLQLLD